MNDDLQDGQNFGGYTILGKLGRGGMASVYRAYEAKLEREVALKVLPAEVLAGVDSASRFEREAKLVAMLEHPNIVPLYAYGIDGNRAWMALRLVRGSHLGDLIDASLSRESAIGYLQAIAAGLDYAHSKSVVHRDLKPQNVLVSERGEVYLADFGIARLLEGATLLTQPGLMMGTPQYMAPEQAQAETVGPAADIYSLGIIAYQMLTGVLPFTADTPLAVATKHVCMPLPLEPLQSLPEPARLVLVRALSKTPEDRWDRASTFVEKLARGLAAGAHSTPLQAPGTSANTQRGDAGLVKKAGSPANRRLFLAVSVLAVGIVAAWMVWPGRDVRVLNPAPQANEVPVQTALDTSKSEPVVPAQNAPREAEELSVAQTQSANDQPVAGEVRQRPVVKTAVEASTRSPENKREARAVVSPSPVRSPSAAASAPQTGQGTYSVSNGVVSLERGGLQWLARDNGRDIAFDDAAKHCGATGAGWRLPGAMELLALYESPEAVDVACGSRTCRILPPFRLSGSWLWTSEPGARGTRISVGLDRGQQDQSRAEDRFGMRALCVRG